ncbi:MAG TPA: polyphosphate:AMP phosphotransferase [bacterium]|nr:polyphosphate:AMP phosphotransferase [bacterium]
MFEDAEVGHELSKDEYRTAQETLRVDLLNAQFDLRSADFSVLVIVSGDDRFGRSEVVDLLHEWMDARYLVTNVFSAPTDEERERPRLWRYWRGLPPRGRIGIHLGGPGFGAIVDRLNGKADDAELVRRADHVRRFERTLTSDGVLVLKFWLHVPRGELKKRLKRAKKDPTLAWAVDKEDRRILKKYGKLMEVADRFLRATDTPHAPWRIIETTDSRYRNVAIAVAILGALQHRLANGESSPPPGSGSAAVPAAPDGRGPLDSVDLSAQLPYDEYKDVLREQQARFGELARRAWDEGISPVLAFEGWDAAGKGGAIRRLTRAVPAKLYRVTPIAAPTEEERSYPWLWRFWRHLPRAGRMAIFDRSWYGRVLVERVEGFADEAAWRRAYEEINDFEDQLVENGAPVIKFWLHLDPDEQLRRFRDRERTPYKKYKITDEDYRNRGRWDDYVAAVNEMVARTSTATSPWHLVAANDKRWARVQVLRTVGNALERALDR